MASHVVVVDSTFRRLQVKVNPGTFLTDVLEEACGKWRLNSANYGFKNNNKQVDLSRAFRQTGLTSGSKLELVAASRTPTAISIALQLPEALGVPGSRLTDRVSSNTTLWKLLRHFEEKQGLNLNFTGRGVTEVANGSSGVGRIFYEMPVLNTMGRELSTFGDLQKTLAQLGLSGGSCMIRLTFRKTDQPLEEAMKEIGTYFKEEETSKKPMIPEAPNEVENTTDAIAELPSMESTPPFGESKEQDSSQAGVVRSQVTPTKRPVPASSSEGSSVVSVGERSVTVFSAPSGDTPQAALRPHNEDDYEPTVAHAKLHQSRLLNNTLNKRLLSDAEVERAEKEKAAKLAAAIEVEIKIRFPDQTVISSKFRSTESGADLYKFVQKAIVAEQQPFKLVWTSVGPQVVPRDEKKLLIKHLGFHGRVLVNFLWEDSVDTKTRQQPALKSQLLQVAQDVKVPEVAGIDSKDDEPVLTDKGKGIDTTGGGGGKSKGVVPKWFKGLGKK